MKKSAGELFREEMAGLRNKKGLTQEQLASQTGGTLSASMVAHVETGRRLPTRQKLEAWLIATDATKELDRLWALRLQAEQRDDVGARVRRLEDQMNQVLPAIKDLLKHRGR